MTELDISKLKNIFSALNNEKRIRIIELCSSKEYTVTQLSKLLRMNYSIVVEYTSLLQKVNLINKIRKDDRTVAVRSLIRLNNNGEVRRV